MIFNAAEFEHDECDISSCGAIVYSTVGTWPSYLTLDSTNKKIIVNGT